MATRRARPGRRLIVFALVVAALYGARGARRRVEAQAGPRPAGRHPDHPGGQHRDRRGATPDKLEEARGIIDQRVNGNGVAEAEVATQGNRNIVVEIPGENRSDLVDDGQADRPAAVPPGRRRRLRRPQPSAQPSARASASASAGARRRATSRPAKRVGRRPGARRRRPKGRALSGGLVAADEQAEEGRRTPVSRTAAARRPGPAPSSPPPSPPAPGRPRTTPEGAPVDQPLQWMDNPGDKWLQKFAEFTCPEAGKPPAPGRRQPEPAAGHLRRGRQQVPAVRRR